MHMKRAWPQSIAKNALCGSDRNGAVSSQGHALVTWATKKLIGRRYSDNTELCRAAVKMLTERRLGSESVGTWVKIYP